ncbi:MAG: flagellar biosynthetic protein FliO [Comamonas sp.]
MDTAALLRMIVGLALVIAAILLSAWLTHRFGLAGATGRRATALQVQATLALGPRHRLAVVRVEDARLVIGIGPQGLTLLHTLPSATPGEDGENGPPPPTPATSATFPALLAQWLPAPSASRAPRSSSPPP